jgi:hypothetical protein
MEGTTTTQALDAMNAAEFHQVIVYNLPKNPLSCLEMMFECHLALLGKALGALQMSSCEDLLNEGMKNGVCGVSLFGSAT